MNTLPNRRAALRLLGAGSAMAAPLMLAAAPSQAAAGTMTDDSAASALDRNKDLVRAYQTDLWAKGDLGAIDRYWAPDAKVYWAGQASSAVDAVRNDATNYWKAFTDVSTTIHHLIAEGDMVVLHWSTEGLQTGTYSNVPATGKRITMGGMDLMRISAGKFTDYWSIWDGLSVFEQLGRFEWP